MQPLQSVLLCITCILYIRVYMTVCALSHLLPLPRFATQHVQQRNQQLLSSSEYQACRSHMNSSVENCTGRAPLVGFPGQLIRGRPEEQNKWSETSAFKYPTAGNCGGPKLGNVWVFCVQVPLKMLKY